MVDWQTSAALVAYPEAVGVMQTRAADIAAGRADELIWLLEHPPIYTAGTSAKPTDLIDPDRFPVYEARRGGQYTYHGPGQRVAYTMLHVAKRGRDVRAFVNRLEAWVIATLAEIGVVGERRKGRVGVWVQRPGAPRRSDGGVREDKIAAIGVRLHKWVSFHGISINVSPDLSHYDGIVPCGIGDHGVTSLADLGLNATLQDVDAALKSTFATTFDAP